MSDIEKKLRADNAELKRQVEELLAEAALNQSDVPEFDETGAVIGDKDDTTSFSDHKSAGINLQELNDQLTALGDGSPVGASLKDASGRFLMANKTFAKWSGLDPSDFRGKTVHDIFIKDEAERIDLVDKKLLKAGGAINIERDVVYNDGETRSVVIYKTAVVSEAGEITAIASTLIDVS